MIKYSHLPDDFAVKKFSHFPVHLAEAVRREWLRKRNRALRSGRARIGVLDDGREAEANAWVRQLVERFPAKSLELGASEESLVEFAKARAEEGERLRIQGADLEQLERYCNEHGVALPDGQSEEGIARRVGCSLWWRRNLRRVNARKTEALSIALGLVHRRSALYSSHDAVKRRKEQRRRNRALLEALTAINELGQEFALSELADKGMSNPAIRRAELMVRIAGFEYIAVGLGLAGEFITITAPSHYHPRRAASGQRNPKYDGVSTPADTRSYLGQVWGRISAALDRADIKIFGFRVAEPHHDGTPHFHGLFFLSPKHVQQFRCIVARYAVRENREELGLGYALTKQAAQELARIQKHDGAKASIGQLAARIGNESDFWMDPFHGVWKAVEARVCFKAIDWDRGTAAGYIAKYIAKNIDGKRTDGSTMGQDYEALATTGKSDGDDGVTHAQDHATDALVTARRVDAWASTWGIRQFQQVGGPPVGVWRELRRWDYQGAQDVLMYAAVAADAGNWARFVEVMGGYEKRRREMPLQLAKEDEISENRYGEPGQKPLIGVVEIDSGQLAICRMHDWRITRGSTLLGRAAAPWTCVNNSTEMPFRPIPVAMASQKDQQRWVQEIAADDQRQSIRPTDDGYLPPEQCAAKQKQRREALRQFEQRRNTLSDFMGWADQWARSAEAERKDTLQRVKGRDLYRSFSDQGPDHGIQVFEKREKLQPATSHRPRRSSKRTDGQTITQQLAGAISSASEWLKKVNPDPYGILSPKGRNQ